jgi:hypothetical protein
MAPTTYPPYLREKARQLRRERKLTIDQLAECLALPRTTIYYWVRDLPIPRTQRQKAGQQIGTRASSMRYRHLREVAYADGHESFVSLKRKPTFRDFVVLYIAEGFKRSRNHVSLCNSDPAVVCLAAAWIRRLTSNKVSFSIQYHKDQDPKKLARFWAAELGIEPSTIRPQRKSNSNRMTGRTWRSQYGVLTVRVGDTYLRARLQAWMDCQRKEWLDSVVIGV